MDKLQNQGAPQLSVVIITRNEAHNIEACLSGLRNFSEVLVIDNGSTDNTAERAQNFTNTRVLHSDWKGYGATRQIGVDAARNDWILWIDADERMTQELEFEIRALIATAPPHVILSIPRRNYFLGQHIRGCGWSPDRVLRVFNRKQTTFDNKAVHEGLLSQSDRRVIRLKSPLDHHSYINIKQFFDKNLRYALLAAEERARVNRTVQSWELPLRPIWEFFRSYILRRGFLDGLRGLIISAGAAIYVFSRDTTRYFEDKSKR